MAEQIIEKKSSEDDDLNKNEKKYDFTADPEFFSCMLQPSPSSSDPNYIGIRRLLLFRKAQSGVLRRKDWQCNGKGYVSYRNYINRPRNWENLYITSHSSTPGNRCFLVDASVADGYHLQVPYRTSLKRKAGVPTGICEAAVKYLAVAVQI